MTALRLTESTASALKPLCKLAYRYGMLDLKIS
jgi:hypothetical protein